jgi:energy-coupling factor transporter transmembrane protein EcfT
MAELSIWGYRPGHSRLHTLDTRLKLALLAAFSLTVLKAGLTGLLFLSSGLLIPALYIRLPLKAALYEMRYLALLLLFVFIARVLSTPGDILWQYKAIRISDAGLLAGALACGRLALIVAAGLVFTATTRPGAIRGAIRWYLSPLPFLPRARIATMLSLLIRFLPVVWGQARQTAMAQSARCIERRKNPIYRLKHFILPLFRRLFTGADELVLAMEARCYTDQRRDPPQRWRLQDSIIAGGATVFLVLPHLF